MRLSFPDARVLVGKGRACRRPRCGQLRNHSTASRQRGAGSRSPTAGRSRTPRPPGAGRGQRGTLPGFDPGAGHHDRHTPGQRSVTSQPPTIASSGRTAPAPPTRRVRARRAWHGGIRSPLGFPASLGHVVGRAAVEHELVAVEDELAGAVMLGCDRHHPGWPDQQGGRRPRGPGRGRRRAGPSAARTTAGGARASGPTATPTSRWPVARRPRTRRRRRHPPGPVRSPAFDLPAARRLMGHANAGRVLGQVDPVLTTRPGRLSPACTVHGWQCASEGRRCEPIPSASAAAGQVHGRHVGSGTDLAAGGAADFSPAGPGSPLCSR